MTNLINRISEGVFIIAATPFNDSGRLNLASTDRMVDFCLDTGVTGMTIPGIMGEAPKMAGDEAENLFDAYLPMVRYEQQLGLGLAIRKRGAAPTRGECLCEAACAGVFTDAPRRRRPDAPSGPSRKATGRAVMGSGDLKLPTSISGYFFGLDLLESSVIHSLVPLIDWVRIWGKIGWPRKRQNAIQEMRVSTAGLGQFWRLSVSGQVNLCPLHSRIGQIRKRLIVSFPMRV